MCPVRAPHRSGVHRAAALALFRALVAQSRALALPAEQRAGLLNFVRNRFRQWRHVTGLRRLRLAFDAGYEAIDYLDAAVAGDEASKSHILALLERAHERTKQPPQWTSWAEKMKLEREAARRAAREAAEARPKVSVFDRPRPLEELSGRRHVPKLVYASGLPMLRIKKPQPASISGYINKHIGYRERLHGERFRLDEESRMAGFEDEWEDRVAELVAKEQSPPERVMENGSTTDLSLSTDSIARDEKDLHAADEPTWREAIDVVSLETWKRLKIMGAKIQDRSVKMLRVVDDEQALRDQERAQRQEARKQRWLARESS